MALKLMYPPQKDSPTTFLLGDISATDVLMTVASAAVLPQKLPYPLTIGIDKTITETVMVTSQNLENNQLTISRGSPAYSWTAGAKVARVLTATDFRDVQDNIMDIASDLVSANELILESAVKIETLESTVGDATSGLIKDLADEVARAKLAEQTEVTRATTAENAIDVSKVNRVELPQVITDWQYTANGTALDVTITRYNATNKQTTQFVKTIPIVSDESVGVMTPEAYTEITSLRNDVAALQNQGGRFIGVSFATKSELDAYVVPPSVHAGDFTYVLVDETKENATTRYIFNGASFEFAYVINYAPIGIADTETAGLVKSSKIIGDWTLRSGSVNNAWSSVCYGNGTYVAVGKYGTLTLVMTSPDGINWTPRTSSNSNQWRSVCYGNGLFVAVSQTGAGNRVMTSPDGIIWTSRTSAKDYTWSSVCFGNGLFVAVSEAGNADGIMTSSDGINWVSRTGFSYNWQAVCHGDGLFVAVASIGTGKRVMTSSDGITWVLRNSAADNWWTSVCFGRGLFVAVAATGVGNRLMTSPDGVNWSPQEVVDNDWQAVTYGNGLFVAVASSGTGNRIMTSENGINWSIRTSPEDSAWQSVCFGKDLFVSVGGSGSRIMTSQGLITGKSYVEIDGTMSVLGWDALTDRVTALETAGGGGSGGSTLSYPVKTIFNADGSIDEIQSYGGKNEPVTTTVFTSPTIITQITKKASGEVLYTLTTTFNPDGSISEVLS